MKKCVFKGVATALVTPFKKDLSVDYRAFEDLVDFQIKSRVSALVVAGTTGEGTTLSQREKCRLLEICLKKSEDKLSVIAATGANDTALAVKRSLEAEKVGANALLVITPYYNKTTDNGLIRHFFTVADSVKTPIIIYDVPSRTGMNISPETYKKLSLHKNIVGIKEADENFLKIMKTSFLVGDKLCLYSGNDDTFLPFLSCGGSGIISVLANLYPQAVISIYNAYERGDNFRALEIKKRVYGLISALFCQVNPIPIKYAMSLIKRAENVLRLPLVPIDDKYKKNIAKEMKKLNLI